MFVTVILGEKRAELLNLNCRIVNFIHCLKEKCKLDPQVQVDLLDRTGELMHLMEVEQSMDLTNTLLKGRQSYFVVSVSLMLRKLSNLSKKRDKRSALKKGSVTHIKTKATSTSTKSATPTPGS
ncbi:hypothetical protein KOW79_003590 [Hemibagrus wyckioides]|uniref:Uncharacterized protein n=1 Tax=Hemibagrus wyckioides TaxID=337641 RepID=A0A9D3SSG2_9TELE|nr:hypothetical protein KOW79_003590 [Hemibagrus wyckioides]